MSESTPFPNLCRLISCHGWDQIQGWTDGTCGTPAMLTASGVATMTQQVLLSDGTQKTLTVTVA